MKILDQNLKKLIKAGVYNKEDEHDACGVGFVASIDGKPRREVVEGIVGGAQLIQAGDAEDEARLVALSITVINSVYD